MIDVNKLKEEELNELKRVNVEAEEVGLEDLIVLGEKKKIPMTISFPNEDGTVTKGKALIRQLTLKEIEGIKFEGKNLIDLSKKILRKAFFKSTGDKWSNEELEAFPAGVITIIATKILELSGIDTSEINKLQDF